jgi:hypothetical protein
LDKTNVFFLSCDEVISIDNQSWLSIDAYTIQNWTKVPMLLSLKHLMDGFNVTSLIIMIMQAIFVFQTLISFSQNYCLFSFNGVNAFQGCYIGVVIQL